jgi:hypothetical protein
MAASAYPATEEIVVSEFRLNPKIYAESTKTKTEKIILPVVSHFLKKVRNRVSGGADNSLLVIG